MMHEKLKYDLRKNLNNHVNKDLQCNNNRIERVSATDYTLKLALNM